MLYTSPCLSYKQYQLIISNHHNNHKVFNYPLFPYFLKSQLLLIGRNHILLLVVNFFCYIYLIIFQSCLSFSLSQLQQQGKMQGDVFGWRQTEDASRLEAEDSQWTVPGDETRYAWDPWTKRAYLLGRKVPIQVWCWEYYDMGWWAGVTFFLGSVLFILGSTAAIFKAVGEHEEQQRWLLVWPYFIGALLYTAGCVLLVTLSVLKHPRRIQAPADSRPESPLLAYIEENKQLTFTEDSKNQEYGTLVEESQPEQVIEDETSEAKNLRSFLGRWKVYQPETPTSVPMTQDQMSDVVAASYVKDDFYHIRGDPWYLRRWCIDLSGSLIIAFGSILYILSCGTELYKDIQGDYPNVG
eukprot:TRINITY_DN4629_c0_g2_i2.p2 TRINITY_DN4629_c0_g2~~TRINITY_DN4629_c0_g2_i2.p2  ORF type:complete len:354 (+),score=12.26 TRINITY_DN4629_c0_g2_i2:1154-2215(+)